MKYSGILAILCLIFASLAFGEEADTRSPEDRYVGNSSSGVTLCQLIVQAESLGISSEGRDTSQQCVEKRLKELKDDYLKFAKTLKSTKAKDALKEHYAKVGAQIKGVIPAPDEIRMSYSARQAKLKDSSEEAWMKFDIER